MGDYGLLLVFQGVDSVFNFTASYWVVAGLMRSRASFLYIKYIVNNVYYYCEPWFAYTTLKYLKTLVHSYILWLSFFVHYIWDKHESYNNDKL